MNIKNKNNKFSKTKNKEILAKRHVPISIGFFVCLMVLGVLFAPEAFAVKDGEMKTGVTYLTGLLDNNVIPLVLLTGIAAGSGMAYMKSSFSPLVVAICTAGGYGFAHKWISSVYTICI